MKYIIIALAVLFFMTGCTKKEIKTNFYNVKDGVKKDWKKTKESVSETTKEYKEKER